MNLNNFLPKNKIIIPKIFIVFFVSMEHCQKIGWHLNIIALMYIKNNLHIIKQTEKSQNYRIVLLSFRFISFICEIKENFKLLFFFGQTIT